MASRDRWRAAQEIMRRGLLAQPPSEWAPPVSSHEGSTVPQDLRDRRSWIRRVTTVGRSGPLRRPVTLVEAQQPLVSIIVVCWNAASVLGRCLEALERQSYANIEVVVADDGSDDASVRVAVEHLADHRFSIVRSTLNRGCSAARNLGLKHVRGEIIAFIDADGFAHPDWAAGLVETFCDETIGGAASVVFFDRDPLLVNGTGGTINRQWWAMDINFHVPLPTATVPHEVVYAMGCGMAVRRAAIAEVGAFDEKIINYYDDVDYGLRLWRAGWRVVVARAARIDHGFGQSGGASRSKQLMCERHRIRVALKHAPVRTLPTWLLREMRSIWQAPLTRRVVKREAWRWNYWLLPDTLRQRSRLRGRGRVPAGLFDPSLGERFIQQPTPFGDVDWKVVGPSVDLNSPGAEGALPYGWFGVEDTGEYRFCWSGPHAAAMLSTDAPADGLMVTCRRPPWALGDLRIEVRSIDGLERNWSRAFSPSGPEWHCEVLPAQLPAGQYMILFEASDARPHPPDDSRPLGLALRWVGVT